MTRLRAAGGVLALDLQGFGEDVANFQGRVQGRVGVLEDHLQVLAQLAPLLAVGMGDVVALKGDGSLGDGRQPQHGPAQGGLAGSRLPHQAQGLPRLDGDVDVGQGPERLAPESLERVFHVQARKPSGGRHRNLRRIHRGAHLAFSFSSNSSSLAADRAAGAPADTSMVMGTLPSSMEPRSFCV